LIFPTSLISAVHYDVKWRGITFATTRQGMGVTGGSPFGFDVGAKPGQGGTLKGLDLGVRGMRVGGQRRLLVPPQLAYGSKGYGEVPGDATLTMDVALLSIKKDAIG
jgi:FKBP-type peptidyl-prolyl cis-trans isomerase 2